jgi:ADP-ribose pyrophosphatase
MYPRLFSNENAQFEIILDRSVIRSWQEDQGGWRGHPIGILYEDEYIIVIRDLVKFPDGTIGGYTRLVYTNDLKGGMSVAIFPMYENKIVLLWHYRHSTRRWHLEIPRGFGVANLPPEENAVIELYEEFQAVPETIENLGIFYPDTGIASHAVNLFFAELKEFGLPENHEGIEKPELFDLQTFEEKIRTNEIMDSFTLAAYSRCKLLGLI